MLKWKGNPYGCPNLITLIAVYTSTFIKLSIIVLWTVYFKCRFVYVILINISVKEAKLQTMISSKYIDKKCKSMIVVLYTPQVLHAPKSPTVYEAKPAIMASHGILCLDLSYKVVSWKMFLQKYRHCLIYRPPFYGWPAGYCMVAYSWAICNNLLSTHRADTSHSSTLSLANKKLNLKSWKPHILMIWIRNRPPKEREKEIIWPDKCFNHKWGELCFSSSGKLTMACVSKNQRFIWTLSRDCGYGPDTNHVNHGMSGPTYITCRKSW